MPSIYPFETPPSKYFYTYGTVIGIYPTPDDALTAGLRIHYVYDPTTLASNSDTPLIRAEFHDAMVKYAISQIIRRLNPAASIIADADWAREKERAVSSHYVADEVFQIPHKDY